jgi:signal peptidase I
MTAWHTLPCAVCRAVFLHDAVVSAAPSGEKSRQWPPVRENGVSLMKTNRKTAKGEMLPAAILIAIFISHTVSLFIPAWLAGGYYSVCRPTVYLSAVIAFYAVNGRDGRPLPKGGPALPLAAIGVLLYCTAVFIAMILARYGRNPMVNGLSVALRNLWVYGTFVCLSEVLRAWIIKGAPAAKRRRFAVLLTLVYTFAQLDSLRAGQGAGPGDVAGYFMAYVFPAAALHAVLSFIACEGPLAALLALRCAYSLTPVFLPVLPSVSRAAMAAMNCSALFATAAVYYLSMGDRGRRTRLTARKLAKNRERPLAMHIVSAAAIISLCAFILRAFPYFPVIVLTGSMAGPVNRGSVVFVEKLALGRVLATVEVDDVILFRDREMEVLHRVVEFRYNASGDRVYITKGDANPAADNTPVGQEKVIGISKSLIPNIGYPFVMLKEIFGK